ncbi:MAG: hypothetical protein CL935_03565 [Deltaproteobacteria bacterium]|nr:hypothetical protein [Deltaproteobacteria bacterium]|tara:strand:- start:857 stop:1660 length:804 start_codon:yes stop_codon:yes gene_type:complete
MENINKLENIKRPWVVAHRGYSARFPENTASAFDAAISAGADMIELDVCITKDRVPVVIHDQTLERTTDGAGMVSELNLSELKKLDAGSWFSPEFKGESIPTLEEILLQIRGKISVNIEIKPETYELAGPPDAIEKKICIMVEKFGLKESVLISSFEHSFFPKIKFWHKKDKVKNSLRIAPLHEKEVSEENALNLCKETDAYSFHHDEKFLTPSLIEILKKNQFRTIAYTINNENRIEELTQWGVTGIITDDPEIMWKVLRKLKSFE